VRVALLLVGIGILIVFEKRGQRGLRAKSTGVFGWLQADTVAAVWIAAAAIHREKNTVEAAAAAGLQPQQAAANKLHIVRWRAFDLTRSLDWFIYLIGYISSELNASLVYGYYTQR
jgi:hypothetical protein